MTAPARITRITVSRLRVPLTTPYRLAFGPVEHFDTIIVEVEDDRGQAGFGEATVLTGYTEETIEGSWAKAQELAASLVRQEAEPAMQRAVAAGPKHPFVSTAFGTALEMLSGNALL